MADSFVSRRLSEFAGVASFAAGLIWLISLASYTPTDPAWFFNDLDSTAVANFAGRVGAFLAEASFQIAGYSAFLGPVILGVVGWNYFWCKKINASYTKLVGATLLVGCVAALLSLASSVFETGDRQFGAGGAIGDWIAGFCSSFLNRTGASILLLTVMMLAIILATHFSFGRAVSLAVEKVRGQRGLIDRWRE